VLHKAPAAKVAGERREGSAATAEVRRAAERVAVKEAAIEVTTGVAAIAPDSMARLRSTSRN
jgi:hypothetical protein